jgi:arylsulfatase A-like enzyme
LKRAAAFLVDCAAVVAAWAALAAAEPIAVALLWPEQFTGVWEIAIARRVVAPLALAMLAPLSALVVGGWRLATAAAGGTRAASRALAAAGAIAGAVVALGVTQGRHFASWAARGPFVLVLALLGAGVAAAVAPSLARPGVRPTILALLGVVVALAGWAADATVLPRLYPAFHLAMLALSVLGAALVGLAARAGAPPPGRAALGVAALVALAVTGYAVRAARGLGDLDRAANLRVALYERGPLLGQAVALAARLRPDHDGEAAPAGTDERAAPGEVARSLDWTGHDLVLVTVDALRADHVSAYGYARATTPELDALAAEGAVFEAAYCPTPHTSYSVTSMMTGEYMRPLLALGIEDDSETWAQHLRRYGWRTAAFYPPAVFYIDADRFARFERERLGFEYSKEEFADPALRERQVSAYLDGAPADRPLFLWVHFFEPHEPYVLHPEHAFSGGPSADVDAYDGEVATADEGIGRIVRAVRERRPGAVVIVTADHGEEFGEHGGRYHGTSVYEEQVRVPLVVVGPGVRAGTRVPAVVQTIDLLPTALSALGVPRPARLRGRDLGPLLAGTAHDPGVAFAEAGDYSLVAAGPDRLVCNRRVAACSLYRPGSDPLERRDVGPEAPARLDEMRGLLRAIEREHGRYAAVSASAWPEALRRGLQGDIDAAVDVASLLDDADVGIRRKAAEVSFALHAPAVAPQLARASARDEDDTVRRWAAVALARAGGPPGLPVEALLRDADRDWRRRAALALAEHGDPRACDEVTAWWAAVAPPPPPPAPPDAGAEPVQLAIDLPHAQELLAATARARCRSAVPQLLRALDDVRARPFVADALGALGDPRARGPLRTLLAAEPYVTTRPHEEAALHALGD